MRGGTTGGSEGYWKILIDIKICHPLVLRGQARMIY